MKRLICVALVLLTLVGCLTACSFTQKVANAVAEDTEANAKVEEMLTALAKNRQEDAEALMHPSVADGAGTAIGQMCSFFSERAVGELVALSVNVNTSTGTSGKTRQEQITYRATLSDGDTVYLNVVHLSDKDGVGFISFQLILGVV